MIVQDIVKILQAEVLEPSENLSMEINCACGADLMSDVMAYVKDNVVLLTGLVNLQVIRTAEMMDIKIIVFVRGKIPDQNILDLAAEKKITILRTVYPMYIACGKLYSAGLTGAGVWNEL